MTLAYIFMTKGRNFFQDNFAGSYNQGYQYGGNYQQPNEYIEVTIEPSDATIRHGEKANLTCRVKGAQQYTLTWNKYAQDKSLPNYAEVSAINTRILIKQFIFILLHLNRNKGTVLY